MSQTTTLNLLPQTVYVANYSTCADPYTVVGATQPGASYYISSQCAQTITYSFSGVTGKLVIDATLATSPVEKDWFSVFEITANASTGVNANACSYTNVEGNFVYLRAKIIDFSAGIVNWVKVSY